MQVFNLSDMVKGWFIGDFEPTLLHTTDFEVAVKRYKKGDSESRHLHKLAVEYTVIIAGEVIMNNIKYKADDIIKIDRNESTDFFLIIYAVTVVVKAPSCKNDKYAVD